MVTSSKIRPRMPCPVCAALADVVQRDGAWRTLTHQDRRSTYRSTRCVGANVSPATVRMAALSTRATLLLQASARHETRERLRREYEAAVKQSEEREAQERKDATALEKLAQSIDIGEAK